MFVIVQNNMKHFLILCLFSFTLTVNAKEYTVHNCDYDKNLPEVQNLSDARSCHRSCKKTGVKVSFRTKDNTVMQILKVDGKTQGQTIWKNCTVFDDENWNCDTQEEPEVSGSTEVRPYEHNNMTNGKYIYHQFWKIINYKELTNKTMTLALYCAK